MKRRRRRINSSAPIPLKINFEHMPSDTLPSVRAALGGKDATMGGTAASADVKIPESGSDAEKSRVTSMDASEIDIEEMADKARENKLRWDGNLKNMRSLRSSLKMASLNGRDLMELAMEVTQGTPVSRGDAPHSAEDDRWGRGNDEDRIKADPQSKHLTSESEQVKRKPNKQTWERDDGWCKIVQGTDKGSPKWSQVHRRVSKYWQPGELLEDVQVDANTTEKGFPVQIQ